MTAALAFREHRSIKLGTLTSHTTFGTVLKILIRQRYHCGGEVRHGVDTILRHRQKSAADFLYAQARIKTL